MLAVLLGAVVDGVDRFGDRGDVGFGGALPFGHGGKALLDELPVFALRLLRSGVAADEPVFDESDEPRED